MTEELNIMDLVNEEISSKPVKEEVKVEAKVEPKKVVKKEESKKESSQIDKLKAKFDSTRLEKLRKIDFLNQYTSKLPEVSIEGLKTAWVCDTPHNAYLQNSLKEGWIKADLDEYPPVSSGYSDQTGEDRYAHHLLAIPLEIYDRKQKAISDLTNKRHGHILNPNSNREPIQGDGMYNPGGRKIKSVNKVIENE